MHTLRRKIGPVAFEVRTDILDILSMVEHALEDDGFATGSQAVVTIRHSSASAQRVENYPGPGNVVFHLKHVTYAYDPNRLLYHVCAEDSARGIIDFKTSTAEWDVLQPMLPRSAFHVLVLDPLSLLLTCHSVIICHGAAVAGKRGAVLLFGRSGCGKSTLGFLISHENPAAGIRFMSDDTLILDCTRDVIRAYPINSGFGLTPDLIRRFSLQAAGREVLQRSRGKVYLSDVPRRAMGPQQVDRIVFLEKCSDGSNGTEVSWLDRKRTLRALLDSQMTIASPYIMNRLTMCQRLARQAPGVHLRYTTYCDLDVLRRVLEEDLSECAKLGECYER